MAAQPKTFLTPAEYLEIERRAEYKSESYAGEMFAMSGDECTLPLSEIYDKIDWTAEA